MQLAGMGGGVQPHQYAPPTGVPVVGPGIGEMYGGTGFTGGPQMAAPGGVRYQNPAVLPPTTPIGMQGATATRGQYFDKRNAQTAMTVSLDGAYMNNGGRPRMGRGMRMPGAGGASPSAGAGGYGGVMAPRGGQPGLPPQFSQAALDRVSGMASVSRNPYSGVMDWKIRNPAEFQPGSAVEESALPRGAGRAPSQYPMFPSENPLTRRPWDPSDPKYANMPGVTESILHKGHIEDRTAAMIKLQPQIRDAVLEGIKAGLYAEPQDVAADLEAIIAEQGFQLMPEEKAQIMATAEAAFSTPAAGKAQRDFAPPAVGPTPEESVQEGEDAVLNAAAQYKQSGDAAVLAQGWNVMERRMRETGIPPEEIDRLKMLLLRSAMPTDPEADLDAWRAELQAAGFPILATTREDVAPLGTRASGLFTNARSAGRYVRTGVR